MDQEVINQIESAIEQLYANGQYKLKQICNKEMMKFGGISQKDYDCFYSRAGLEISVARKHKLYDPSRGKTPLEFFTSIIKRSVWKEITDRNRGKRQNYIEVEDVDKEGNTTKKKKFIPTISIDTPIGEENDMTIKDTLQSDFDMEALFDNQDEKVEEFLCSLPKTTRQIIEMRMNDIPVSEIKNKLNITDNEYYNCINSARMNENLALFTKKSNRYIREENKMSSIIPIDVTDNYRMDKFPLGSLLDDMRDGKINKKHILQRKAFQWTERQKNKYLTRVLNGQPIPEIVICEQVIKGKKKSHLIDGLQRLSYSELFRADGIVVKSDGAEFSDIPYKEYKFDENGDILVDDEGDALFEEKIFNVIGKKFSEYPQYLKDRFNKFNINVTTYFNCTDEQIAYHIRNYNNQEGMNKSQYEFTGIDVHIAERIKNISDRHTFFKDTCGKYTEKNKTKGDLDKVVVESIMAIYFINDWKKEVKDSFAFVNSNVTDNMFDSFEDTLDRLSKIIDKEVKGMFTVLNSPVWFAVFEKFKKLNLSDEKFREFIKYVMNNMGELKVDRKSFADTYKSRNTRDKITVVGKVDGLTVLMYEFLHINKNTLDENKKYDVETFLSENVEIDKEILERDLQLYNETLDKLKENTIRDGSKLLDNENNLSLLAMVAYSYKMDIDLDEWMMEYAEKNDMYYINQKKNYLHMKNDLNRFIEAKKGIYEEV